MVLQEFCLQPSITFLFFNILVKDFTTTLLNPKDSLVALSFKFESIFKVNVLAVCANVLDITLDLSL